MSKPTYLSFSQLKLFKENPLKYLIQYCEKIRLPGSDATRFGTDFDDCVGNIIKGEPLKEDTQTLKLATGIVSAAEVATAWAEEFNDFLILRKGEIDYQVKEAWNVGEGIPDFTGYADLVVKANPAQQKLLEVHDFKTCTYSRGYKGDVFYGLNQENLTTDLQLAGYCISELGDDAFTDGPKALISHIQVVKEKYKGKMTKIWFRWIYDVITGHQLKQSQLEMERQSRTIIQIRNAYSDVGGGFAGLNEIAKMYGYKTAYDMYSKLKLTKAYGKPCPFLNFIRGRETLEDLKARYKDVKR